jgi:hypothetical protein
VGGFDFRQKPGLVARWRRYGQIVELLICGMSVAVFLRCSMTF